MFDLSEVQSRYPQVLSQTAALLDHVEAGPVLDALVAEIPEGLLSTDVGSAEDVQRQLALLFMTHGAASTLLLLRDHLQIDTRGPMRTLLRPGRGPR